MNSDGVSLPTTIAQLGNVAKTQSRVQQQGQNVTPFKDQLDRQEDLKVQRVKQAEAADHRRIETDEESPDKRQRRRQRRERKLLARDRSDGKPGAEDGADLQDQETVGVLIDLRA